MKRVDLVVNLIQQVAELFVIRDRHLVTLPEHAVMVGDSRSRPMPG